MGIPECEVVCHPLQMNMVLDIYKWAGEECTCAQRLKVPDLLAVTLVSSDSQAPGRLKIFPSILHLYLSGFLV